MVLAAHRLHVLDHHGFGLTELVGRAEHGQLYLDAKDAGYNATHFLRMLNELGGVATAKTGVERPTLAGPSRGSPRTRDGVRSPRASASLTGDQTHRRHSLTAVRALETLACSRSGRGRRW
jgi:hypothetical protein